MLWALMFQAGLFQLIGLDGTIFTRINGVMILSMFAGCLSAHYGQIT